MDFNDIARIFGYFVILLCGGIYHYLGCRLYGIRGWFFGKRLLSALAWITAGELIRVVQLTLLTFSVHGNFLLDYSEAIFDAGAFIVILEAYAWMQGIAVVFHVALKELKPEDV